MVPTIYRLTKWYKAASENMLIFSLLYRKVGVLFFIHSRTLCNGRVQKYHHLHKEIIYMHLNEVVSI